jgi:bifunctional UDP-N-acetylglucosamine pyrophosphorylase/glucosamine-1-phosphate N-acetyltransferase
MNTSINNTEIIVLAAGKGTRMGADVPKVIVPAKGKPMVNYVLDAIEGSDFPKAPLMVVGYERDMVIEACGDRATYVLQKEQLGTGHAAMVCRGHVSANTETFLVLYGDQPLMKPETINNILRTHNEHRPALTMATTISTPEFDDVFKGFSRILRNDAGEITGSVEVRDATPEQLEIKEVNPAYLCFDAKWAFEELSKLKNDNNQSEYYLTDLARIASEQGKKICDVQILPQEAFGANTPEQLEFLEQYL